MKKRILALLLALCMLVFALPAAAADDDAQAAYRAYAAWLEENKDALDGYVWQYDGWQSLFDYDAQTGTYTKKAGAEVPVAAVAIEDLDSDGIPELVYIGVKDPLAANVQSELNIFTYRDGKVTALYSEAFDTLPSDGTTRSFSLYTRSGKNGLFLTRTETTSAGTSETFDVVREENGAWQRVSLAAKSAEGAYTIDGAEANAEDYAAKKEELGKVTSLVLYGGEKTEKQDKQSKGKSAADAIEEVKALIDTPTPTPTATPEPTPTAEPTTEPTAQPTATAEPTAQPTAQPTATAEPTAQPTATAEPTAEPTAQPTAEPTATPEPTTEPTATPTARPTATPTPKTATPTPRSYVKIVNVKNSVSVRKRSTVDSTRIGYAYNGEMFPLIAVAGSWYKIQYTESQVGYIYEDYILSTNEYLVPYEDADDEEDDEPTRRPTSTPTPRPTPVVTPNPATPTPIIIGGATSAPATLAPTLAPITAAPTTQPPVTNAPVTGTPVKDGEGGFPIFAVILIVGIVFLLAQIVIVGVILLRKKGFFGGTKVEEEETDLDFTEGEDEAEPAEPTDPDNDLSDFFDEKK